MQNQIGKIKKVPLREIWGKEDKDFTKWLEENIEYLNEVLNLDLNIVSREKKVGPFRVDLLAEDQVGNKVIIENQLEKTDHDHLGKIITYLTNLDAKTAIWITNHPVEEHIKAVDWLNENAPDDVSFYLLKIEAIKIASQPMAAPLFTIINEPTEESKQLGEGKKEYAQRHILRKKFWTSLLEKANKKTDVFSGLSPGIYSWLGTGAGKSGVNYNFVLTNKYLGIELYFDRGKEFIDPNINKIRFDKIYKYKNKIEKDFGKKLLWDRLEERRASRIAYRIKGIGLHDEKKWNKSQDQLIDDMIKFMKVTQKYVKELE